MTAEAQLALAVLAAGLIVAAVLSAAMAVLQRRIDQANSMEDAAVEARFGRDMAELAEETHPR